jgi:hypothetical protein
MVNLLPTLIFTLFTSMPIDPNDLNDQIQWNANTPLQYEDFQGAVPAEQDRGISVARTNSTIGLKYELSGVADVRFNVTCFFSKSNSWMLDKSPYILAHEQRHFDLTEIYARKLRRDLSAMPKCVDRTSCDVRINAIFDSVLKDHRAAQRLYDQESAHSANHAKQAEWSRKIQQSLGN